MTKKFEMIKERDMYRIVALRDFDDVFEGDIGGLIEHEANLSHDASCWIYDNAEARDNSRVSGNAKLRDDASVEDYAEISGHVEMREGASVCGHAKVSGCVEMSGYTYIGGDADVSGETTMSDRSMIVGDVKVVSGDLRDWDVIK